MTEQQNLLITLMEECGELEQAISKALRFGMSNHHPSDPQTNEHKIMTEYYHIVAVMEMLTKEGVLHPFSKMDESLVKTKKADAVRYFQGLSRMCGCISEPEQ